MKQLPLFSASAEASRTLQEHFDLLCHDYRYVETRLETARAEYRKLREERDALQREQTQLRHERDAAQTSARHWQAMYEIAVMLRSPAREPATEALEPIMKKLLTTCHPDKWSQGQDASALAHELTVVINRLRERGQP